MQDVARRVLIIDDTETDRLSTRFLLERSRNPSYVIEEVDCAEKAVEACRRFQPECVLLDYGLPDRDGLEVLSLLKSEFGTLRFAVVLLTGSGDELLAVRALKGGAQDYIPKDALTQQMLERTVQSALEKLTLERQRQDALAALAANERKLRDIINAAPCALYTIDLMEGRSVYVSGFSEGLIGYLESEIEQWGTAGMLSLIHADDRATLQRSMRKLQLAEDGEVLESEFRFKHKKGSWHWLSVRNRIVGRNASGAAIMAAGAATDITHRKQMEADLHESQTQLVVAQEAAGIGTWAWDLEGQKLTCSSLFMKLYGREDQDALRSQIWDEWVDPQDRPRLASDLAAGLAGRPFGTEFRTIWPDGSVHWLRSQGKLTYDTTRGPRFLGAALDMTEKKRVEEELRRSNEELERFAYVASHDLQEPLRSILSFSQLFTRRNKNLDAESKQYLDFIRQGGQRMQALIADLLTFSRVTQAEQEPVEEIDCNEVLGEALIALHASVKESGAEIEAADLPKVVANFNQMAQLLQNLIGNAIKYKSQATPVIQVSALRMPRGWRFCVSDNGIGFDMSYSERIFEAFKRLHSRDQYSGTGIGLAICKRIVERHGGRIWAESTLGHGARFYFTICDAVDASATV
jgi:PAS domain S-box-containing protein